MNRDIQRLDDSAGGTHKAWIFKASSLMARVFLAATVTNGNGVCMKRDVIDANCDLNGNDCSQETDSRLAAITSNYIICQQG